jgi:hypothetical protein
MKLKYGVVALTPLLGAGGFAQGLNLGMNDGVIVQAQAPAQTGSYEEMNGSARPETDLRPEANGAGAAMGKAIQLDTPVAGAENLKTKRPTRVKAQARKTEKKAKDTRTN